MLSLTNVDKFDNLTRIEYQGQLVLTTAQLAEFYECEEHQIRQNFRNNADRFIEKKHMFTLRGLELKNFKHELGKNYPVGTVVENFYSQILSSSVLRLWTKRGAARHAKMLSTDKAWEVFEILEDNYFDETVDYYDTTPGADFWWEHEKKPRPQKDPNSNRTLEVNIRRANALCKLADRTGNAELREQLLTEAAKILASQN